MKRQYNGILSLVSYFNSITLKITCLNNSNILNKLTTTKSIDNNININNTDTKRLKMTQLKKSLEGYTNSICSIKI